MKAVSAEEAIAMIPDGATVMVGGFMGVGTPERLLDELVRQQKSDLTLICNDAALPGKGIGKLIDAAAGLPHDREPYRAQSESAATDDGEQDRRRSYSAGHAGGADPRRRLRSRRRADADRRRHDSRARASRRSRSSGKIYLLETALHADFALVHAFLADYSGNLSYALTARNFNPLMAMAADTVIVTAEHIVPVGVIAPDHVVTPAPLVDYLIANG